MPIPVPCKLCGNLRWVSPSVIKKGYGTFCSASCRTTWHNNHRTYKRGYHLVGVPWTAERRQQQSVQQTTDINVRFDRSYEVQPNGCWVWKRHCVHGGYGYFSVGSKLDGSNRKVYAHRFNYERYKGPLLSGMEIDHLCRNRACVNPDHLEAVTHAENVRRGNAWLVNAVKMHCKFGHPYTEENTYRTKKNGRTCRQCQREHGRKAYARKKWESQRSNAC